MVIIPLVLIILRMQALPKVTHYRLAHRPADLRFEVLALSTSAFHSVFPSPE
jgi:hypothetical protein